MAESLKVLTYNCWHALTAKNLIQFRELEPPGRKAERYKIQLENLKRIDADFVFLQEVSPIHERINGFKSLGYDVCTQVDQSGIKAFGFGIPMNLSTGLVILAKPEMKMRKLFGQKLSGNPGFTGVDFSFQITENRYAVFASSENSDFGRTLLVCTHLHHGTENTPLIESMLKRALGSGLLSAEEYEISKAEIKAADLRRKNELDILFSAVHVFEKSFDQIIFAGDLNSSESSQAYTQVLYENFKDTYRSVHVESSDPDYQGFTWDIEVDHENIEFGHQFELPMNSFGREDVRALFNEYNDRRRRIDFIFLKNLKGDLKILDAKLLKFDSASSEIMGSDHLAVLTNLGLNK